MATRARILADYVSGGATAAEFDYLDGVTSSIQTQLDAKSPTTGHANIATVGTVATGTWEATDVAVAHGGTGASTHTANNVLIGAGTSAITSIAPGADGQVLTSTGTVWQSEAAAAGGKIKNHWENTRDVTSDQLFTFDTSWGEITYGSNEFKITGITATEGNFLHISVFTGSIRQVNVDGYRLALGFKIDTTEIHCAQMLTGIATNTQEVPGTWFMIYEVPASFTSKEITARGQEEHTTGAHICRANRNFGPSTYRIGINVFEIQA